MGVFVIVNPNAGSGRAGKCWPGIRAQLFAAIGDFEFALTKGIGDATQLAKGAVAAGANVIVVVGGDGTANETVNGFIDNSGTVTNDSAMALIPCGTGSDLCKTFGFDGDLQSAIEKIAAGREQLIDVGRLEFFSPDEKPVTRFFLNIVSFGLSGVISNNINHSNKFEMLPGKARYLIETLRALFDYDPVRIRLMVDDVEVEEDIMLGAVANGRYFGGGMMVAPNADPQDGQLDVVLLRAMSKARLALKIPHVYLGTHLNLAEVVSLRGSKLHIWALPTKDHKPVLLDVDGESPGHLGCKITVLSKALRLVV